VGGVVGGIIGAVLLSAIVYFFISRRRKNHLPITESAKSEYPPSYQYGSPTSQEEVPHSEDGRHGGAAELPAQTGKYSTLADGEMNDMERRKYGVVHHASGTHVELPGSNGGEQAVELP
jgi:hypothetical protein